MSKKSNSLYNKGKSNNCNIRKKRNSPHSLRASLERRVNSLKGFTGHEHNYIDLEYDTELKKLLDLDRLSYIDPTAITSLQQRKGLAAYQSYLLHISFCSYSSKLLFDCDYLTFTCPIKESRLILFERRVRKQRDKKDKAHDKRFHIKDTKPKNPKQVCASNRYKHAYSIKLENTCGSLDIDVRDNDDKKGIRVTIIPSLFDDNEFSELFKFFKTLVGSNYFKTFKDEANITRVDTGLNLVGIAFPFLFAACADRRVKKCRVINLRNRNQSETTENVRETEAFGSLELSSCRVMYDVTLKSLRKVSSLSNTLLKAKIPLDIILDSFGVATVDEISMSSRLEDRYMPYKSSRAKPLKLKDLTSIPFRFRGFVILDPIILPELSKEELTTFNIRGYATATRYNESNFKEASLNRIKKHQLPIDFDMLEVKFRKVLKKYQTLISEI